MAQQKGSSKMTDDDGCEVENWDEKPFFLMPHVISVQGVETVSLHIL